MSQIAHALNAKLHAEGSTTATDQASLPDPVPAKDRVKLDLLVALSVERIPDWVFICNETRLPVFLVELKDPLTMGMLLKHSSHACLTEAIKESLHRYKQDPNNVEFASAEELGSLVQTIIYMLSMSCPVACLTDGISYVYLHLRRKITLQGGSQLESNTNVFDLLKDDKWSMDYYVAGHRDTGANPQRCMAAGIQISRNVQRQWVKKQQPQTAQQLPTALSQKDFNIPCDVSTYASFFCSELF